MLRAVLALAVAQVLALSTWFSVSAVLPGLALKWGHPIADLAGLATATQAGFVVGALLVAFLGLADRFDPRAVFAGSAMLAAGANLGLLVLEPTGWAAWSTRALVGASLAGVYPVGLKLAVGWSVERRGLVVSLLVGALTLGSSSPHLVALLGGSSPAWVLVATSIAAVVAAGICLFVQLGPFHAQSPRLELRALPLAWSDPRIRAAYLGYFGHMWELYGFWAWVAVAAASSRGAAPSAGPAVAFVAMALGGLACLPSGWLADRKGKRFVARAALGGSLACAIFAALSFDGPPALFHLALVLWGITVIPDSPQFSALVADAAPADKAGSLMALQTALGFALTTATVQGTPWVAAQAGWPVALAVLGLGPAFGLWAMGSVRRSAVVDPGA